VLVRYSCCAKGEMKALREGSGKGGVVDVVDVVVVVGYDDDGNDKGQKENENETSVGSCHMLTRKFESETSKRKRGDETSGQRFSLSGKGQHRGNSINQSAHVIASVT
jgi:hypothetical protein